MTRLDHDGNVAPWLALAEDIGIVVRFVDVHDDLSLDLDDLAAKRSPRTRVVAFPAAANSVGTAPDVRRVVELAHEAGALAWVDAVHYGPHGPIDVAAWGCDVLVCSPYKFFGPHMGLAFGREELLRSWRPYKVRPAADEPVGHRFELGTCQHELLAGFVAAVDYVALARLGRDHGARAIARRAVSRRPARRRRAPRPADDGGPRADVLLQRARAGRRGRSRSTSPRATSPCGGATTTRSRRCACSASTRSTARSGPGSSTTTRPRRSTGCSPGSRSSLRLLLLGGPKFLGRAVIDAALERGHELTLFNRGTTGADLYPELERIVGDRDGGLDGLRGREWDAVVDTSGYLPRVVGASARLLADAVGSLRLRVEHLGLRVVRRGRGREARRSPSSPTPGSEDVATDYGALKALCERAVEAAFPGRATAVRAGLIVGPHDPTGRFTYWPHRIARGGDVLVPGPAWRPIQLVDVRDLAAWIVTAAEERLAGPFNATGPATMGAVIDAARRASRLVGTGGRGGRRVPHRAGRGGVDGAAALDRHARTTTGGTSWRSTPRGRSRRA